MRWTIFFSANLENPETASVLLAELAETGLTSPTRRGNTVEFISKDVNIDEYLKLLRVVEKYCPKCCERSLDIAKTDERR